MTQIDDIKAEAIYIMNDQARLDLLKEQQRKRIIRLLNSKNVSREDYIALIEILIKTKAVDL